VMGEPMSDFDRGMWEGIAGVTAWPEHDLFGEFP